VSLENPTYTTNERFAAGCEKAAAVEVAVPNVSGPGPPDNTPDEIVAWRVNSNLLPNSHCQYKSFTVPVGDVDGPA
jgi:hypothetical protein